MRSDIQFHKPAGQILKLLQQGGGCSIKEIEAALGVTSTAVRQQLAPLLADDLVTATMVREGRGRPYAVYRLTEKGEALFARGAGELALVLLEEILGLSQPETIQQLLRRVSVRVGQQYAEQMEGDELVQRLQQLVAWLEEHGITTKMVEKTDAFELTEYGCPYYGLARDHREICEMETEAMEMALGAEVVLAQSRLDGHHGCQFQVKK